MYKLTLLLILLAVPSVSLTQNTIESLKTKREELNGFNEIDESGITFNGWIFNSCKDNITVLRRVYFII